MRCGSFHVVFVLRPASLYAQRRFASLGIEAYISPERGYVLYLFPLVSVSNANLDASIVLIEIADPCGSREIFLRQSSYFPACCHSGFRSSHLLLRALRYFFPVTNDVRFWLLKSLRFL